MTAEIVIMNKEAVALAADSAVTYRDERGEKIFPSANKIFTLSKHHPVGVMVYGGAEFMGVPWETVVKVFRSNLGSTRFGTLREYADALFAFLHIDRRFSPAMRQHKYVEFVLTSFFTFLRDEVRNALHERVDAEGELSHEQAKTIFKEGIKSEHRNWRTIDFPDGIDQAYVDRLEEQYKDLIVEKKREFFPRNLTSVSSRWLTELALWCLAKSPTHDTAPHCAGLVIAGFGDAEIFPSFISYAVGGVVCDRVQVRELQSQDVSPERRAIVAPFAQQEMVRTFMEGVDPTYATAVAESISKIVLSLPRMILEDIDAIAPADRSVHLKKYRRMGRDLLDHYQTALDEYRQKMHVAPIVRAIGVLPKNELAAVAESLVNITAFKRRVSMDAETVGGPIDVAVISKGDGFVWIERKHYFDPGLNQHFIQNYLRSEENYGEEGGSVAEPAS